MSYWVYVLSNKNHTVFYTGVISDLQQRIDQHKSGAVPGFTTRYNCDQLLYCEEYSLIDEAIAREKALKKFKRDWKFQLITKFNPDWLDLAEKWYQGYRRTPLSVLMLDFRPDDMWGDMERQLFLFFHSKF